MCVNPCVRACVWRGLGDEGRDREVGRIGFPVEIIRPKGRRRRECFWASCAMTYITTCMPFYCDSVKRCRKTFPAISASDVVQKLSFVAGK